MRGRFLRWLTILAVLWTGTAAAQATARLSGRLTDSETGEALPHANIFINNTTLGTSADAEGAYELKNIPAGTVEVVFSFVGYQAHSQTLTLRHGEARSLSVKLVPLRQQLSEVEVKATRDKAWEQNLKKFETIFLGKTVNSTKCTISNPWVLDFTWSPDGKTMLASAGRPIEVENRALGYRLSFLLKSFKAGDYSYSIQGLTQYAPLTPADARQQRSWESARLEAYQGSDRHLFRSLVEGRTREEGFLLYAEKKGHRAQSRSAYFVNELGKSVAKYPTDSMTRILPDGKVGLTIDRRMEVHFTGEPVAVRTYKDLPYQVSWIEVTKSVLRVNPLGVVENSSDVYLSGVMSESRMADLLPLDYDPTSTGSPSLPAIELSSQKWEQLRERAYLRTDKPYYYGGEKIWFGGMMEYRSPALYDTLSKVAYVELIGPARQILTTTRWSIDSGLFRGQMVLPDTIAPGNYTLRAYTQWMRNYGQSGFYSRSVPVLAFDDKVYDVIDSVGDPPQADAPRAAIILVDEAKPRERITVKVHLKDASGPMVGPAVCLVSVTDKDRVVPLPTEPDLVDFSLQKADDNVSPSGNFPFEYGFTVSGQVLGDKGKPESAAVNVVVGKLEHFFTIVTVEDGSFSLPHLNIPDSTRMGFQAVNSGSKSFGSVRLNSPYPPPTLGGLPVPPAFITRKVGEPQRTGEDNDLDATAKILTDVEVKGERIEDISRVTQYGKPDYVVTGEQLGNVGNQTNVLMALQGKVPGLTVQIARGAGTTARYRIRIRGGTSTFGNSGTNEPLLMINGIPFTTEDRTVSIIDLANTISPNDVDRIEVITSANPRFGARGVNGIIAIYTKAGTRQDTPDGLEQLKGFLAFTVRGFNRPLDFVSPNYARVTPDTNPDFRTTIYWNPALRLGSDGRGSFDFYAADLNTTYRILIEGRTYDGRAFRSEAEVVIR
jgi:hypothetical protein